MTPPKLSPKKLTVDLQPVGRRADVNPGQTVLEAAQESGVGIISLCGGEGWCESCRVRLSHGEANPLTESEHECFTEQELSEGVRLACQLKPQSDVRIDIPAESLTTSQRLQVEGQDADIQVDAVVQGIDVELEPPSLEDLRSDVDRVKDALQDMGHPEVTIALPLLAELPTLLRAHDWHVRLVVRDDELIAVLPAESALYGLAVDIGTTKLALYLVDLASGEIVEKTGAMNPQIAFGEDVISRIGYANQKPEGRQTLQDVLVESLNEGIQELCQRAAVEQENIVDAVVVGNTAIHHLFAGLPVEQLVFAPYVPAISEPLDIRANDIGIQIALGAYIHLLPNIAGYVGADHSAVILSTQLWQSDKTVMAIDIGTNTEISLVSNGVILSCSCASGPAFEGAHISHGMRAAPGSVERVQIIDGEIKLFTIENQPPIGICGSGILDIVAELRTSNSINDKGAFSDGQPHIRPGENGRNEFLLAPAENTKHGRDITVSRSDINEIQLAKAAIRAGLEVLMQQADITAEDIDEVIIAGAFGTYIDVSNAIKVGMFPNVPVERFRQIGNAAGMGAVQALLSKEQRQTIAEVIQQVKYIELTTTSDFQRDFVNAMYL